MEDLYNSILGDETKDKDKPEDNEIEYELKDTYLEDSQSNVISSYP